MLVVLYVTPVQRAVHANPVVDAVLPLSVLVLPQSRPGDRELNLLLSIP